MNKTITVEATVNKDPETVWNFWNAPEHVVQWMHASDDWECTKAVNDLKVGGRFSYILGAKDKSVSFDLAGVYTEIRSHTFLAYTFDDGRTISVSFTPTKDGVSIVQTFEMEHENSEELQRSGWQATLDSFKSYIENDASQSTPNFP